MRRLSSAFTRAADTGTPAGIPSRIATNPRPWLSPAVVHRNVMRVVPLRLRITREPDRQSGSRWPHRLNRRLSSRTAPNWERVNDRLQPHHHQAPRGDAEEQLVTQGVFADPQRPDDRIAHRQPAHTPVEERVEDVDVP